MKLKNSAFFTVLVLSGINLLNFYDRSVTGALTQPMKKEFGLSDTQIGLLGSAFIWLYAIVSLPIGRLADSWNRKKLLAWGVILWASLTALAAFARTFTVLLFSRLGVGIGEAVCGPAGTSWLGDMFPVKRRARVLAVFMLGVPVGGALSFFFSGPIAQAWGWRAAMVFAALPAALFVPALLILREPERGASEEPGVALGEPGIWPVLKIPTLWWIGVSGVFLNFNLYSIGTFMPAFLSRYHGVSLARSGIDTGTIYMIGGLSGAFLGGYLGDHIVRRRRDGRLLLASGFALIAAPCSYLGMIQPAGSIRMTIVFFALAYGGLSAYAGTVYSSIHDVVPPNQRGTGMAFFFVIMYLGGASWGPLLTGTLSDRMAKRAMAAAGANTMTAAFEAVGLQQAMLIIIPVLAVGLAIVLYIASRTVIRDVDRREARVLELTPKAREA